MQKVSNALILNCTQSYYTDSSIVLSWLQLDPANMQVFLSNRVNYIQVNTSIGEWNHIDTKSNPADLISRGLYPHDIINNKVWFNGPKYLLEMESDIKA